MTATTGIVFWTLAFAVTHMGMSSLKVRPLLVARLGEGPYLGLYSLVSFATFVPLVSAYLGEGGIHGGPLLWNFRMVPAVHIASALLAFVSFTLALSAVAQPSPASIGPSRTTRAHGLTRITRHPLFMNVGVWALAHLPVNGYLNDVLFFGGIFLVGLLGCLHQDARKRITEKGRLDEFFAETSVLPFGAILSGRGRFVASELPWAAIVACTVASAAIYHLHSRMFS